jgi:hypothetical protein
MKATAGYLWRWKPLPLIFVFLLVLPICGCSKPPNPKQLVGLWESTDKAFTIQLRSDGTFAFTQTEAKLTSFRDLSSKLGFFAIAPSGRWQVHEWELEVTCGRYDPKEIPLNMSLKIVSWSAKSLALRFGNGDAVRFVRRGGTDGR